MEKTNYGGKSKANYGGENTYGAKSFNDAMRYQVFSGEYSHGSQGDGVSMDAYIPALLRQIAKSDARYGPHFAREFARGLGEAYGKAIAESAGEYASDEKYSLLDHGKLPSGYNGGHCKTCTCSGTKGGQTGKSSGSYTMKSGPGLEGKLGKNN